LEEELSEGGVKSYCRYLVDMAYWNPRSPHDVALLLKEIQSRNLSHQIDYDGDTQEYTAYVWVEQTNDQLEKSSIVEYSHQDKCLFYAISKATAKMVRYAIED